MASDSPSRPFDRPIGGEKGVWYVELCCLKTFRGEFFGALRASPSSDAAIDTPIDA